MILSYKNKIRELENEIKSKIIEINIINKAQNNLNNNYLIQINDLKLEVKILVEELEKLKNMFDEVSKENEILKNQ